MTAPALLDWDFWLFFVGSAWIIGGMAGVLIAMMCLVRK